MSFGRGRGGFGRGRGRFGGGFQRAKQEPIELFPEIAGLETVKFDLPQIKKDCRYVVMSESLQKFYETSPYYYEDPSQGVGKGKSLDIERYSNRNTQTTIVKPPLWHFIKMSSDHMPAELAKGEKRVAKKVRWDNEASFSKFDKFEKLEEKYKGQEGAEKKEQEEEDEEDVENEEDGEFSDEGDYEQAEYCDDDEDDFNMPEENDEAVY